MNDSEAVKPITEASAVWYVGGDQARITRGELANTLQMTLAGEIKGEERAVFTDLPADYPLLDPAENVVSNGWMKSGPAFEANIPGTREEWVPAVKVLVAQGRVTTVVSDSHKGATVRLYEVAELIAHAYGLGDKS